jgi:hypothetical protein
MRLRDLVLYPFKDTPAEAARKEGTLMWDEETEEWIELADE